MSITRAFGNLIGLAIAMGGFALHAETLMVFAAASLTDSLKVVAQRYEAQSSDKIEFNFAASSVLARQIEEGAPADVFFSADDAWMDELEKKGLIVKETRKERLSNSLVIIIPRDSSISITSPGDLAKVGRIALGDPKTVPAGIYAREYLQKQKLWDGLEPKVIPTANVRAALAAVASGDADAGIVYKTDAAISKQVKVAYEVPTSDGPKIAYPMAAVKGSAHLAAAKKFLYYLNSAEASPLFEKFGFVVIPRKPQATLQREDSLPARPLPRAMGQNSLGEKDHEIRGPSLRERGERERGALVFEDLGFVVIPEGP